VDPPRRNDPPRNDPPRTDPGSGPRTGGDDGPRTGGGGGGVIEGPQGGSRQGGLERGPRGQRPNVGSRSGNVRYGTVNNLGNRGRMDPSRIDRAPIVIDNGVLSRRVGNSEQVGIVRNGIRIGYYHYNPRWCDDWFVYPHYVFDPWAFNNRCYPSPWYYYVSLPAYLNPTRVIIVNNFPSQVWTGQPYRWQRDDGWDRGNWSRDRNDLDMALEDMTDAFERADRRSASRLIPRGGNVNIYTDGRYSYSLNADDFYDLYMDGLYNNDTRRYEILNVEMNNRGDAARVLARHESIDPWGNRQTVYHQYYLERERRDFVIREFGTSVERGRW
jgi:hypothetical protein